MISSKKSLAQDDAAIARSVVSGAVVATASNHRAAPTVTNADPDDFGSEADRRLPLEPHVQEPTKLLLKPRRGASWPADHRQPQLASQIVGRGAKLDLGTLGADRFGGQVGEEKARVGAVG